MLFSFAVSQRLRICSADITNAYFQGEEMDRILLLRPAKEGLEEENLRPGQLEFQCAARTILEASCRRSFART